MSLLDDIVAGVREDLAERESRVPRSDLDARVAAAAPVRDPLPAFRTPGVAVIAEVKRRSPSKGDLASIPDPAALATAYVEGGAAAVSVLTEQRRFGGSLADLEAVRAAPGVRETPLLRKDFVVTEYQVAEARAAGADLVLLIVAALEDGRLRDLHQAARGLGMRVLVETHDAAEVERAVAVDAEIIGVNARDLRTLEVDTGLFARLRPAIPVGVVAVAESGITGPADVTRLSGQGADVVLVGEALVTGGDPATAVKAMRAAGDLP